MAMPTRFRRALCALALTVSTLTACGGGGSSGPAPVDRLIDFAASPACVGADADYTVSTAPPDTVSASRTLPPPFNGTGWRLSGTNRSDDLFIYTKCKLGGLQAGVNYRVGFLVAMLTSAPTGCIGVGGAPGEAVTLHAGVSLTEPLTVRQTDGYFRVNLDRGNQSQGGSQSQALGHIGNTVSTCGARQFADKLLEPPSTLTI